MYCTYSYSYCVTFEGPGLFFCSVHSSCTCIFLFYLQQTILDIWDEACYTCVKATGQIDWNCLFIPNKEIFSSYCLFLNVWEHIFVQHIWEFWTRVLYQVMHKKCTANYSFSTLIAFINTFIQCASHFKCPLTMITPLTSWSWGTLSLWWLCNICLSISLLLLFLQFKLL